MINYDLLINEGKFKLPLILGNYNKNVDKFKEIEGRIKRNIDEWVGNLYFSTRILRVEETSGHKERLNFIIPKE